MLKGESIDESEFIDNDPVQNIETNPADPFAAINNMFANKGNDDNLGVGEKLIKMVEDGSGFGIYFVITSLEYQTVRETMYYGENVLSRFPERIIFSLGANDADNLIENVSVAGLRENTVYFTDGVKNIQLTAAYATIANGGVYEKPVFYTKIVDHDGNVLMDNTKTKTRTVLKESTAYLLTSAMEDVVKSGTGKMVNFDSMSIAGKTGTTSQTYDVWFSGYTPYYTCSVWGGYDVNTSMYDASYHKGLWKAVMQRVHEKLEFKEFQIPDSVTSVQICKTSGKLANKGCPTAAEYFEKGTEPTETCGMHVSNYSEQEQNTLEEGENSQEGQPAENEDGSGVQTIENEEGSSTQSSENENASGN